MSSKAEIEAQLQRRLAMSSTSPSMLNLSEGLAIAAINHGIDISGFNSPQTFNTEQAALMAQGASSTAVDPATGEIVLMAPEGAPGPWVALLPPDLCSLPENPPIHKTDKGHCHLEQALDWLRDMANAMGWLTVQARSTGSCRPVEFREVIVAGTPLSERANGRDWRELMDACVSESHVLGVARWLKDHAKKNSVVQIFEKQLSEEIAA